MNSTQLDKYLQTLEEMIVDEEKIVTFKTLSRTLGINVNLSKQLLYTYLEKQKKNNKYSIIATHLLAGLLKEGTFLVSIISGDKLNQVYGKYEKISSEHVYSIQKGKISSLEKNNQILYATDTDFSVSKSYPIKYHEIIEEKIVNEAKKYIDGGLQDKTDEEMGKNLKERNSARQSVEVDEKKIKKQDHITVNQELLNGKNSRKYRFEEYEDNINNAIDSENRKMSTDEISVIEKINELPEGNKKKRVEIKKDKKKRKRILSSSDDSESDQEKRDALFRCENSDIDDNAETQRVMDNDSNYKEGHVENKKRRKKFVDKTILLNDGFMETCKEVVYETDSDGESPGEKEKETKRNDEPENSVKNINKQKKESPQNNQAKNSTQKNSKKQSTLLSFFKKK